jgi:hypothetical protein
MKKSLAFTFLISEGLFALTSFVSIVFAETPGVAAPEEQIRMTAYLQDFYKGVKITHQFTEHGQLASCVNIYTQPSLNHPDLHNHQIQRQPSPGLMKVLEQQGTALKGHFADSPLVSECPEESIPIHLYTLEEVARFKTLREFQSKPMEDSSVRRKGATANHQYAAIRQNVNAIASQSTLNIWSPNVERNNEFSLSQIWLQRGSSSDLETVEAGWQVYPSRNGGDVQPHFFIYYTPDNYSTGCYDLTCPAFIQTNPNITIGMALPGSVRDGLQQEGTVAYWRDPATGNWWLVVQGNITVGYYPTTLFDSNGIRDFANVITYGGEIIDSEVGGKHTATDMGSGDFPVAGSGRAAYQRSIQYMDTSGNIINVTPSTTIVTDAQCYDLAHNSNTAWGRYFYFGGGGYNNPACE